MNRNNRVNFAFFGTSSFAVKVLSILIEAGYIPRLIVTTPDMPVGRKAVITPPMVKSYALSESLLEGVPIIQPEKLSTLSDQEKSVFDADFDLFVVVDYGKIIPQAVLDIPKTGSLNVHVSLLPKYRGASPMQTALLDGASETGVTIMEVVAGLDEGAIVAQEKINLSSWQPTFPELAAKSAEIGGKLLVSVIPDWINGKTKKTPQDISQATYTKKFKTEDGYIDPATILGTASADVIIASERRVRALNPNPGTWTELNTNRGQIRLKILSAKVLDNKLIPISVIPAGKNEMSWEDFERGNKLVI